MTTVDANVQALATAEAIADAQRVAVEQERARCLRIAKHWADLWTYEKATAGSALERIILGIANP